MPRAARATIVTAPATAVLFAAWVGLGIGGEAVTQHVDDLMTVGVALAATVLCLLAAGRHGQPMRRFWLLMGAASGLWTVAEIVWAVYELVLRTDVPVPSWADLGYLGAVPVAVAALLVHPAVQTRRARSLLDGLTVATALLFLSWTLVIGPLWSRADGSGLAGFVTLAYPFGDVVIVFFVVAAVRGMSDGGRASLWFLLAGLLAMALSDSAYAYLVEVEGYATGSFIDTGWVVGYLGIATAAAFSLPDVQPATRRLDPWPAQTSIVAPFIPILAALGFAAVEFRLGHNPDRAGRIMAFALVALVLLRQALFLVALAGSDRRPDSDGFFERLAQLALGGPPTSEIGTTVHDPPRMVNDAHT